jgi:flagellar hook-basal body complex protein FliE
MQRASGLGRAWIIALGTTIPIDENSRFLALLIFYVDAKAGLAAMVFARRGGIRGNVGVFGGFYRLWTRANGVTLGATLASCPTSKESVMAVSGLSGIESMLQQMRTVVSKAETGNLAAGEMVGQPDGFAAELQRSIRRVTAAQNASSAQARAFEMGAPDISLNDVIIDMQKASLGFQTAVQVRNKLVAAYKEISSMAV